MRSFVALISLAVAVHVNADAPTNVDGIPVFGRLADVSEADVHDVIVAFKQVESTRPSFLKVISSTEVHVYRQSRDRGWTLVRHGPVHYPDGRVVPEWTAMDTAVWSIPEALQLMGTAKHVYVFPVANAFDPHRDDRHMRLLGREARESLERLLGDEKSWLHGFKDRIWAPDIPMPRDVGFLFAEANVEVVLFCLSGQGLFNGQRAGGDLEDSAMDKLEVWKRHYAQPELEGK